MSTKPTDPSSSPPPNEPKLKSQMVFKWGSWLVFIVMLAAAPGFWKFRLYCQEVGYYVVDFYSLWWLAIGFFSAGILRRGYYIFIRGKMQNLIDVKYEGFERKKKMDSLLKLSYDMLFYGANSVMTMYLFWEEGWFPSCIGGRGSCEGIFKDYPDWPANKRPQMQAYYLFHLGVHFFSLVELPLFRWNDRKFYEWGLHHLVTVALLLFSLTCNEIPVGIVILFIHDVSDAFLSAGRFYSTANIKRIKVVSIFLGSGLLFTWIYGRLIAYPSCMIYQLYANLPNPSQDYYMILYECWFIVIMTCILLLMHIFWSYFLYVTFSKGLRSNLVENNFDSRQKND